MEHFEKRNDPIDVRRKLWRKLVLIFARDSALTVGQVVEYASFITEEYDKRVKRGDI